MLCCCVRGWSATPNSNTIINVLILEPAMKKVLVIEDDPQPGIDAFTFFFGRILAGQISDVELVYADCFEKALSHLQGADGVILEIEFLSGGVESGDEPRDRGTRIVTICRERGVPCVLCVDFKWSTAWGELVREIGVAQ